MISRSYRKYDQSFRDDAVGMLLRGDRTEREVASALGVPKPTLRNWYMVSMATVGKKARGATTDIRWHTLTPCSRASLANVIRERPRSPS